MHLSAVRARHDGDRYVLRLASVTGIDLAAALGPRWKRTPSSIRR